MVGFPAKIRTDPPPPETQARSIIDKSCAAASKNEFRFMTLIVIIL
jgi:hypothetical protein